LEFLYHPTNLRIYNIFLQVHNMHLLIPSFTPLNYLLQNS
jgi:hypothetical protein